MNPNPNIRWFNVKHWGKWRAKFTDDEKRVNRFNDKDKKFVACLPSLPVSIEYLSVAFFMLNTRGWKLKKVRSGGDLFIMTRESF